MARVLIVGSYSPSLVRFRGALIRELVTCGHSVLACGPESETWVTEWLDAAGAEFEAVPLKRTGTSMAGDIRTIRALAAVVGRWQPSHVLAYTVKPVVYGAMAARLERVPHFCALVTGLGSTFLDQSSVGGATRFFVRTLYRHAMSRADRVLFQNGDDLEEFLAMGLLRDAGKARLVRGSGVDLEEFSLRPLPDTTSFLLIARLIKDKGIAEFAEAARIVKRSCPGAKFRLAGWMDSNPGAVGKEALDQWVREGIVEYLGELHDVRHALGDCLVYVLPSYREGTPRTVLEAMAMGRPIITTDVPGCRETVVDGENGYLVPAKDPQALARAMLRAIESRDRLMRMGKASRRIAESRFDVNKVNVEIMRAMGL